MSSDLIIGKLITATAPRRRALRGVVLPPKPGSRSAALRITVDGGKPKPFNPDGWTIAVKAGRDYQHGTLPAEHLATRTMLKAEMRLQPRDTNAWIATYAVRKGSVPLYAVADAVPLAALSPARAEEWAKVRTCVRCGEVRRRPLPLSPEGPRYCDPCHQAEAVERWTRQARAAQADAAAWAREVLEDTRTLLVATVSHPPNAGGVWWHLYAETTDGAVLTDARIRYGYEDRDDDVARHPDFWTPERIAEHHARREGTISRDEAQPTIEDVARRRIITWRPRWSGGLFLGSATADIPEHDCISDRLALWAAWSWGRTGYWYPTPAIPWSRPASHPRYRAHDAMLRAPRDLTAEIADLRSLLHLIAHGPAPEPSCGPEVITR